MLQFFHLYCLEIQYRTNNYGVGKPTENTGSKNIELRKSPRTWQNAIRNLEEPLTLKEPSIQACHLRNPATQKSF